MLIELKALSSTGSETKVYVNPEMVGAVALSLAVDRKGQWEVFVLGVGPSCFVVQEASAQKLIRAMNAKGRTKK